LRCASIDQTAAAQAAVRGASDPETEKHKPTSASSLIQKVNGAKVSAGEFSDPEDAGQVNAWKFSDAMMTPE
jgi:hypothetical protein